MATAAGWPTMRAVNRPATPAGGPARGNALHLGPTTQLAGPVTTAVSRGPHHLSHRPAAAFLTRGKHLSRRGEATAARAATEEIAAGDEVEPENVIPRVETTFEWQEDRPYHRYRDLEHFHPNLTGLQFGGGEPDGSGRNLASPVTYRVTLPDDYDADRADPYPMLIVIPADAGYGGSRGGGAVIAKEGFHNNNDAIVLELGFSRPTWMADTLTCNHESFFLEVILPRVMATHNVGRMSLIGYANGGFGALHMLMRHPHLFHRAAVADVPVLGDFVGELKPWGIQDYGSLEGEAVTKPSWESFEHVFPHNAMFTPYCGGTLAECEYVAAALGENGGAAARVGLWSGARTQWEMKQLREQFDIFGVKHAWSDAYADEAAEWSGGWLTEALQFLAQDL